MTKSDFTILMADSFVYDFIRDWILPVATSLAVFYLIRLSKLRRRTEQLTMIKVDCIAYAMGKTQVGDEFTSHYDAEVAKRIRDANFKEE